MSGSLTERGGLRKNDALLGLSQIHVHPLIISVKLHLRLNQELWNGGEVTREYL